MGIVPTFQTTRRKSERRQTAGLQDIQGIGTLHDSISELYIWSQFSAYCDDTPERFVRIVFIEHPKLNMTRVLCFLAMVLKHHKGPRIMVLASLEHWLQDHTVDLNDTTKQNLTQLLDLEFR